MRAATSLARASVVFALGFAAATARSGHARDALRLHELSANRATLVLREPSHLAVTLYINYGEALHAALAPSAPAAQFVMSYAAMPSAAFAREVQRAQMRFQNGVRITDADGKPLVLVDWVWPSAATVQAGLKDEAMQAVVAAGDHPHEQPVEIRADVVADKPVRSVSVQFPKEFQNVLVVSYAPKQVWANASGPAPRISFP